MKIIILFVVLLLNYSSASSQVQLGSTLIGEAPGDEFGGSVDFSKNGNRLAVGARLNDAAGDKAGHVRIYDWDGMDWNQVGADIDGLEAGALSYSLSLSADGNRIVIGAYGTSLNVEFSGNARVFEWNGIDWEPLGQTIEGLDMDVYLGFSVDLSADGNTIAVGAPRFENNNIGRVTTYEWNDSDNLWELKGQPLFGMENGDHFGSTISLTADGKRLAIAAPSFEFPMAFFPSYTVVYEFVNQSWIQMGTAFVSSNNSSGIGNSLSWSSDGNTLGIARNYQEAGSAGISLGRVDVYQWDGIDWDQKGPPIIGTTGSAIGSSLVLSGSGDTLAIGSVFGDDNTVPFPNAGQVYMYQWNEMGTWDKFGNTINGTGPNNRASEKIALTADGKRLAVGATWNDNGGEDAGHLRVFQFDGISSLGKNHEALFVNVYPNPSSDFVSIDLRKEYFNFSVRLKDQLNQTILSNNYDQASKFELSLNGLAGVYYLEIITATGVKEIIKVIKL